MDALNGKRKTCYRCAECGKLVEVNACGALARSCTHDDAGVIAGVSATTYGAGGMVTKDAAQQ